MFLGYSIRSKAYKCLNTNTNKIVKSENVNFDEYTEVHDVEPIKKPKEYKSFVYYFEGMYAEEEAANQVEIQQQVSVSAESQLVNVKLNLGTKLHSDAELKNEENAHSNSKFSTHDRDVELPKRNMHSYSKAK